MNSVRELGPKNFGQAKWTIAMADEPKTLEENGVSAVVVPPIGSHEVGFKDQTDADGARERFKDRLVACGNDQVFDIDYGLTFAAVMDLSTVKVILLFVKRWRVPASHGNIHNAYVMAGKEQHLELFLGIPKGGDT
ncbi:hypothetical protein PR002_g7378 [Phytophthora rubi]|uniref:Reverse transcriptase Ty1/copia-type domain-containing protein n=1 Tax=Phytophthora rubi TaxID=129364 RepID=A0A6A3MWT6_9STRA|nr:hypothetical protein PR002_g7378 [Phytophthora rubi]